MANPRLNLPFITKPINDDAVEHLVRTLREWSRHVDALLDAHADEIAALDARISDLEP